MIISITWKAFLFTPIVVFALTQLLSRKFDGPKLMQISASGCAVLLLWGSLYLDALFWFYGEEVAACCNWCYNMEDKMSTQKIDSITISKVNAMVDSKMERTLKLLKTGMHNFCHAQNKRTKPFSYF